MLTGQLVGVQPQAHHSRAPPELRRNVACAARRSFLVFGTLILVYQPINLSKKVRTGQSVGIQTEFLHGRAEAELRWNVACEARRSFLFRRYIRILVPVAQFEHKIDIPLSWLPSRWREFIALQRPSSVGIGPVIF